MALTTAQGSAAYLNRAFKDANATLANFSATATDLTANEIAAANKFDDKSLSDAALSKLVLTNMGILPSTVAAVLQLETELAAYFGGMGKDNRGFVVLQLARIIADLTTDTTYGTAAKAWNTEVAASITDSTLQNIVLGAGTGTETSTGGQGDDTFAGTLTSLASALSLDVTDKIDGAAGNDTLSVTMNTSFTGFTTGSLKNVETVNLTNGLSTAREFNAKGITGVNTYNLNADLAAISLTQLGASGGTVNVNNQKSGDITITFASTSPAISATTDTLTLGLTGAGTAPTTATSTDTVYLTPQVANIESLTISSTGSQTNYVDLAGVSAAKTVTTNGSAALKINAVAASVDTLNSSSATGAITADLRGATLVKSISLGSGGDAITVTGTKLLANAPIDGGTGTDTLVIGGGAVTLQPTMSGIEKITLGSTAESLSGTLTYSGKNTTGLTSIDVSSSMTERATFTTMGADALAVRLMGANTNSLSYAVSNDTTGATTVSTVATSASIAAKTGQTNAYNLTFSKAATVDATLGEYTTYSGTLTGTLATSASITGVSSMSNGGVQQSGFSGTLSAPAATSFSLDIPGNLTGKVSAAAATKGTVKSGTTDSTLVLTTAALQELTITNAGALNLDQTGKSLGALSVVNATGTKGALTFPALAALSSLTASGTGTSTGAKSALSIGAVGSATLDYATSIKATGMLDGVTVGTMTSLSDVTLDVAGVTGAVTQTGAVSGKTVSILADGTVGAVQVGAITGDAVIVKATSNLAGIKVGDGIDTTGTDITAKNSLVYEGSDLSSTATGIDVAVGTGSTAFTATVKGGTANDTINITSANTTQTSITVTATLGTGTNAVTINAASAGNATGLTINAAGSTTAATITGSSAFKSTITGGSGADKITGGVGADIISGGSGADTIIGKTGQDTLTGGTSADTFMFFAGDSSYETPDTITDLGSTDLIVLATSNAYTSFTNITRAADVATDFAVTTSGTAKITNYVATFATADDTLAERVTAVNSALGGTAGTAAYFAYNGETYLFIETSSTLTSDIVVKLTGVSTTSIAPTVTESTGLTGVSS